jgi:diacylglycerol kinase family enzyme
MTAPAIVLLNPTADGGRAAALRRPMEQWLARHAPGVPLLAPASADAALATLMVTATRTRVVLVGGDGTVHAMLPAFLRCGHRLGLVAAGSGNDLARALGMHGLDWRKALAYGLKGRVAPIDIGQLQTEHETSHFVSSLAAGLDAQIAAYAAGAPKALHGRARYVWATATGLLRASPTEARVWVNGALEHEGRLLMASLLNTPSYGSGMPIVPSARLDDGRLDAVLLDALGPLRLAGLFVRMLRGRHVGHPAVRLLSGQKMLIDAHRPLALAADGEPLPEASRFTVQVLPRAVYAAGLHALASRPPRGG